MTDDSELTTCNVINSHDNNSMTLCTQWFEWGLKINVFTTNAIVFTGQMKTSDIDKFAKGLSKTKSEYLELTNSILSGKEKNVEYIMKDLELRWKKGKWNYGMIDVVVDRLEEVFSNLLPNFLLRHAKLEKSVDMIKLKRDQLREAKERLDKKLEEVIKAKDVMEKDIYKRFILVLNSKKEKIRELKEELNKTRVINDKENRLRIYDAETEGSEDTDEEEKKNDVIGQREGMNLKRFFNRNDEDEIEHKLIKRQISDSDGKMSDSECEGNNEKGANKETKPSTSRYNNHIDKSKGDIAGGRYSADNDNTKKDRNAISFDSDESEEDMFA